jgi:hypothetical protein
MAKSVPKESSTPVIVALVFFVLTTIAFGVLWYMEYSERGAVAQQKTDAKKEVAAANAIAKEADLRSKMYRVYLGVDDEKGEEKTAVRAEHKAGDKLAAELKALNQAIANKAGVEDPSKLGTGLSIWAVDDKDQITDPPKTSLLAGIAGLAKQAKDAEDREAAVRKEYKAEMAKYEAAIKEFDKLKADFAAVSAALPKDYAAKLQAEIKKFDDRTKKYSDDAAKNNDELAKIEEARARTERQNVTLEDKLKEAQENLNLLADQKAKTQDKFEYDEPQGKIRRRLAEGVVEIDLGSADLVRTGLTFTVLPNDFPEKGRQSRMRTLRVPGDRGQYVNVERFVPKATIEVTQVIGPHLSRARISEEFDQIRDGAGPGDLLYNSVWRKGTSDHIALVGIFDINGDGSDDIETVVRDLTRMGVPVDAYFDMKKRQWVGQITEQTRYVVKGHTPVNSATDPNQADKTALIAAMSEALDGARKRGVQDVTFRDFFPRMGYRVKQDVSDDKINQATAPYLNRVLGDMGMPPPGN